MEARGDDCRETPNSAIDSFNDLLPGTSGQEHNHRQPKNNNNKLHEALTMRDLALVKNGDDRRKADLILADRAFSRMFAAQVDPDERTAALVTACCMISKITFENCFDRIAKGIQRIKRKKSDKKVPRARKAKKLKKIRVKVKEKREMQSNLRALFYDLKSSCAYAGSEKLLSETRKKKFADKDVLKWLQEQDAYNLHRRLRKKFPRRSYNVFNVNDLWEIDLMDLRALKHENDDHTFVLVVIDVLSKYAFAEPMKSKSAESTTEAFKAILKRSDGRLPITLQSDKGKEFVNTKFQTFLKEQNIIFRLVRDPDVKAACIERWIRTLKTRLWRYFTHNRTKRYIDVLQKFVDSYNKSVHSSIGMKPACVNLYNVDIVRRNLSARFSQKSRKPKYDIGAFVRVSRAPNVFRKGYERGWSNELFKIARISTSRPPPVYFLEDLNEEPIDGFYYEEEINPVKEPDLFEIEEIIKTKIEKNGEKKCLVRWKGYSSDFDSWIDAKSIENLPS